MTPRIPLNGPQPATLTQIESRLQRALNAEPMNVDLLWATLADVRRSLAIEREAQAIPLIDVERLAAALYELGVDDTDFEGSREIAAAIVARLASESSTAEGAE